MKKSYIIEKLMLFKKTYLPFEYQFTIMINDNKTALDSLLTLLGEETPMASGCNAKKFLSDKCVEQINIIYGKNSLKNSIYLRYSSSSGSSGVAAKVYSSVNEFLNDFTIDHNPVMDIYSQ